MGERPERCKCVLEMAAAVHKLGLARGPNRIFLSNARCRAPPSIADHPRATRREEKRSRHCVSPQACATSAWAGQERRDMARARAPNKDSAEARPAAPCFNDMAAQCTTRSRSGNGTSHKMTVGHSNRNGCSLEVEATCAWDVMCKKHRAGYEQAGFPESSVEPSLGAPSWIAVSGLTSAYSAPPVPRWVPGAAVLSRIRYTGIFARDCFEASDVKPPSLCDFHGPTHRGRSDPSAVARCGHSVHRARGQDAPSAPAGCKTKLLFSVIGETRTHT